MASMEQLQMLDDDDSSTSSSEDESLTMTAALTAALTAAVSKNSEDESNNNKFWSNHDEDEVRSKASPVGHSKKRIKLSLSGKFKAIVSSPKQESPKQQEQHHNPPTTQSAKATTPQAKDNCLPKKATTTTMATTSVSEKQKASGSPKTVALNKKNSSAKKDTSAVSTSNRTKLPKSTTSKPGSKSNVKPKSPAATNSTTTSTKNKPKEIKKRQSPKLPTTSSSATTATATPTAQNGPVPTAVTKRSSGSSSMRSIRITPMSSPGLLLQPRSHIKEGTTPNGIFMQTMATAGYTAEARTKNPHRGSSVQRTVDDLFDSNVKFCLRFPKLVPDGLVTSVSKSSKKSSKAATSTSPTAIAAAAAAARPPSISSSSDPAIKTEAASTSSTASQDPKPIVAEDSAINLIKRFKKAFQPKTNLQTPDSVASSSGTADSPSIASKKPRSRIPQYSDMIPISLSLTYPDEYIQKRLEYIEKVNEREKAIVDVQEKQQEALRTNPEADTTFNSKAIPPIPIPPDVPARENLRSMTKVDEIFGSEDQQQKSHPLYLPKNKEFIKHLDNRCFRAMEGRYFGLTSNAIADPYFFGPNAPGIVGLNLSASTGLAIASTVGGAASLGSPLFTMPAQQSSASSSATASSKVASTPTKSTTAVVSKPVTKIQPLPKPVA